MVNKTRKVDRDLFSFTTGDLDRSALEQQCGGVFVDLTKAFFMLSGPEAPIVTKVYTCFLQEIA